MTDNQLQRLEDAFKKCSELSNEDLFSELCKVKKIYHSLCEMALHDRSAYLAAVPALMDGRDNALEKDDTIGKTVEMHNIKEFVNLYSVLIYDEIGRRLEIPNTLEIIEKSLSKS